MSQQVGTSDLDTAVKCFAENNRLFGANDAEKFNLYNGLANLALALQKMQHDIKEIKQRLDQK